MIVGVGKINQINCNNHNKYIENTKTLNLNVFQLVVGID